MRPDTMTETFDDLPVPGPSDPAESLDAVREAALRAGLEAYELDDSDLAVLRGDIVEQLVFRGALPHRFAVGGAIEHAAVAAAQAYGGAAVRAA